MAVSADRLIALQYAGSCSVCLIALLPGATAWWARTTRALTCQGCHANPPVSIDYGTAGESAGRTYERRAERYEKQRAEAHPVRRMFMPREKQSNEAWHKGSVGEQLVGEMLNSLRDAGLFVVHDRRIPGSRANIDHVAVAPTGVYVIDTKAYMGLVRVTRKSLFDDKKLYIGGRDRTALVHHMANQVTTVERAIGVDHRLGLVNAALCFVGSEFRLRDSGLALNGVRITHRKELRKVLLKPGPLTPEQIDAIGERILAALPSAVTR